MKKLLTFAGVSALALVTAAPNAFGAFGRYDPSCNTQFGVTVDVYGFINGKYQKLDAGISYDPLNNKYYKGQQEITSVGQFLGYFDVKTAPGEINVYSDSTNATPAKIDVTTNLKAYAAGFVEGGPAEGTTFGKMMAAAKTAVPYNHVATTSTCAIPAGNKTNALILNIVDGVTDTESGRAALPDISSAVIGEDGILDSVSFVVYYAAECISSTLQNTNHATCSFNVDTDGRLTYKNSCMTGWKGSDFGDAQRLCIVDVVGDPVEVDTEQSNTAWE